MRKLDRASVPAPACLASYKHGKHNWDSLTSDDKGQIRKQLEQLQGKRCAYCEGNLDSLGQHIEHFRKKSSFPKLTFSWSNLYWSCDQKDSCGYFKDNGAGKYKVEELLKPCVDDPDEFFRFRANGCIDIRDDLSAEDKRRAAETLRVFALGAQSGRLRKKRQQLLRQYAKLADKLPAQQRQEYLRYELSRTATLPFSTAIRHVLTQP